MEYDILCVDGYTLVVLLTHENTVEILKSLKFPNTTSSIIVDQVLSTGNSSNRYIKIPINNQKVNLRGAVEITGTRFLRFHSSLLFSKHLSQLENSILTQEQLSCIRKKRAF